MVWKFQKCMIIDIIRLFFILLKPVDIFLEFRLSFFLRIDVYCKFLSQYFGLLFLNIFFHVFWTNVTFGIVGMFNANKRLDIVCSINFIVHFRKSLVKIFFETFGDIYRRFVRRLCMFDRKFLVSREFWWITFGFRPIVEIVLFACAILDIQSVVDNGFHGVLFFFVWLSKAIFFEIAFRWRWRFAFVSSILFFIGNNQWRFVYFVFINVTFWFLHLLRCRNVL